MVGDGGGAINLCSNLLEFGWHLRHCLVFAGAVYSEKVERRQLDGIEGLIQFMGNASRHFAQRSQLGALFQLHLALVLFAGVGQCQDRIVALQQLPAQL